MVVLGCRGCSAGEGATNMKVMAGFLPPGYNLVHEKRLICKANKVLYRSAYSTYECQFLFLLTLVLRGRVNRMGILDFVEKVGLRYGKGMFFS